MQGSQPTSNWYEYEPPTLPAYVPLARCTHHSFVHPHTYHTHPSIAYMHSSLPASVDVIAIMYMRSINLTNSIDSHVSTY